MEPTRILPKNVLAQRIGEEVLLYSDDSESVSLVSKWLYDRLCFGHQDLSEQESDQQSLLLANLDFEGAGLEREVRLGRRDFLAKWGAAAAAAVAVTSAGIPSPAAANSNGTCIPSADCSVGNCGCVCQPSCNTTSRCYRRIVICTGVDISPTCKNDTQGGTAIDCQTALLAAIAEAGPTCTGNVRSNIRCCDSSGLDFSVLPACFCS